MSSRIPNWAASLFVMATCGCNPTTEVTETTGSADTREAALAVPEVTIAIGVLDDPATTTLYGAAVRLAVNQMNHALSLTHANLQFRAAFGDDRGNSPVIARAETLRLLNEEHVLAMVSDSSGDTIQINRLNYDTASPAPYHFPVVCYQCSSGLLNNAAATDPDPVTQAALRDSDNWLNRIFYNANFEAKVIDQIILAKGNHGDRNGDGLTKISVYADSGHTSLASALGPTFGLYTSEPTAVEVILVGSPENYAADWPRVIDGFNESTSAADGEPDYVVLAMLPVRVAPAVQAYRAGGYSLPVVSNNSFRRDYILPLVGADADGLEGSSVALANASVSGDLFILAFTAANAGQGPEQTSSGAYDSITSLMLATLVAAREVGGAAKVNSSNIRDALRRINQPNGFTIRPSIASFALARLATLANLPINYDGAYDADDWDAAGDIFPPLVHWKVTNGAFVEAESYLCNPSNPLCPVQ